MSDEQRIGRGRGEKFAPTNIKDAHDAVRRRQRGTGERHQIADQIDNVLRGEDNDSEYVFDYSDSLVGEYGDSMVIISDEEITLEIGYPLSDTFQFPVKSEHGFTKKALFDTIKGVYEHIYREEEATASIPAGICPPLCNRNATDGKYGIRCHDLGDLYLEGVDYDPIEKVARVHVGS